MKRPFRGIAPSRGPDKSYDVVVIGAGVGGLVCANLLARDGLKVLLVEQHYQVGGFCSGFRRSNGFVFDAASHFYPLLGNATTITGRLLSEIGVQTDWKRMDPVDQFHLPDGSTFSVPAEFEPYLKKLKGRFPAESAALDRFFELVNRLYLLGVLEYFRGKETSRLDDYRHLTLRDALDQHFESQELKLVLTADCPHWGSTISRTSFVFDCALRMSYFLGNYFPVGGSQGFSDELARCFEQAGGHILLRSSVEKINVQNNRATGVVIETGARRDRKRVTVSAGSVVSNGDLRTTVNRMLERGLLPPEYVSYVNSLRATWPCYLCHIGVRGISTEVLEQAHGYHWSGWDPDDLGRGAFQFKLFVPSLYDPSIAPPGCHNLVIQKVMDIDYDSVTDWQLQKQQVEQFVMKGLNRIIPGFSNHIISATSASAHTSWRYTQNFRGSMLGWEMSPDQLGANRPDIRFPIDNMYLCGQWTRPGGGITPVIVSALNVSRLIVGQRTATAGANSEGH